MPFRVLPASLLFDRQDLDDRLRHQSTLFPAPLHRWPEAQENVLATPVTRTNHKMLLFSAAGVFFHLRKSHAISGISSGGCTVCGRGHTYLLQQSTDIEFTIKIPMEPITVSGSA
ncbi:hypothetical protein BCY86_08355 [Pajaroellobacter abortibovis]|uniref:Uncharacterized protein n=1 Tax=Pajaroellobacter abortibovis TaxID=1882918 RepID=A0A1L6MYV0_9BACT|nr:hypothetical protein BCY86_08355 [Pajaroellobacter abortibovis]